jgi:membrane protein DedA with SNARE-associated domain
MTFMEKFLDYLQVLPRELIYLLLGVSAYVENLFPPIPGDTITAFGAFLVGVGKLDFLGVYLSTTMGSLLGFYSLFLVGRWLGRRFFLEKDFRFLKKTDIIRAEEWFGRYGYFLVAINRFLPGIRSVISVVGGISRLNGMRVMILALVSCAVWNFIWIMLGYLIGSNWQTVESAISAILVRYNVVIFLLAALVILFFVFKRKYRS